MKNRIFSGISSYFDFPNCFSAQNVCGIRLAHFFKTSIFFEDQHIKLWGARAPLIPTHRKIILRPGCVEKISEIVVMLDIYDISFATLIWRRSEVTTSNHMYSYRDACRFATNFPFVFILFEDPNRNNQMQDYADDWTWIQ